MKEIKKHIYVHEIITIFEDSSELHLECEQGTITFNMQNLFNDIPIIYQYCLNDNEKNRKRIIEEIKKIK
jgi:hypothetical protein